MATVMTLLVQMTQRRLPAHQPVQTTMIPTPQELTLQWSSLGQQSLLLSFPNTSDLLINHSFSVFCVSVFFEDSFVFISDFTHYRVDSQITFFPYVQCSSTFPWSQAYFRTILINGDTTFHPADDTKSFPGSLDDFDFCICCLVLWGGVGICFCLCRNRTGCHDYLRPFTFLSSLSVEQFRMNRFPLDSHNSEANGTGFDSILSMKTLRHGKVKLFFPTDTSRLEIGLI